MSHESKPTPLDTPEKLAVKLSQEDMQELSKFLAETVRSRHYDARGAADDIIYNRFTNYLLRPDTSTKEADSARNLAMAGMTIGALESNEARGQLVSGLRPKELFDDDTLTAITDFTARASQIKQDQLMHPDEQRFNASIYQLVGHHEDLIKNPIDAGPVTTEGAMLAIYAAGAAMVTDSSLQNRYMGQIRTQYMEA